MFSIERKPSVISSDFALFGNPTLVISSSIVSVNVVNPPGAGGYFGVKRIGMTVGDPRKLPYK